MRKVGRKLSVETVFQPHLENNVTLPPYYINMKIIMPDKESKLSAGSQLVFGIQQAFVTTALKCSAKWRRIVFTVTNNKNTHKL